MWRTVKLGDVCTISNGGTPKSKTKNYWDGGVQWLTPKDMGKLSSRYVSETERQISQEGLNNSSAKLIPKNSVILSCRAPIGHVAINESEMSFNQGCKGLVPSEEIIVEYLYYFLVHSNQLLNDLGTGAVFKEISAKTLNAVEVPLPPIAEQQRIVAKLDAAFAEIDRAVETCEEQVSETEKLESHSLTSLFSSDEYVVKRVNEIAEIKGGKRLPKGKKLTIEDTGFPYIRVSDFNDDGSIDEESVQFVEPDVQAQISRYTISSSDVYVSIAGTIGKTGIVPPNLDNANLTENAAKLVFKEGVDRDFVYFFTRTSSFEKQAIAQTRQAAQPKLALERLGAVELPIYELPQQRKIAFDAKLVTEEIAKIIANRKKKLLQLAALKSAILAQELQPPQSEAA